MKPIFLTLAAAVTTATLTVTPVVAGSNVAAHGTFTGASDHITTGGVSIVKTANGGAVVILDSDFSITDIALMTGFTSLPHFINCYKATYGQSPTKELPRSA